MAAPAQLPEHDHLYRIGDVSRITDTKAFVLRFWETEFPMLQPVKEAKGHRLYRQEDIDLIRAIRRLLYEEGFTIAGARRHLADVLANGESWAAFLERPVGTVRAAMPAAAVAAVAAVTAAPAASLFPDEPHEPAEVAPVAAAPAGVADPSTTPRAPAEPPSSESRAALLAVRDELRAILTLLEAR